MGAVAECDAFISRERPKCRSKGQEINRMPADVQKKCEEAEKKYAELITAAEAAAEESLTKSHALTKQAIELKDEIDGWKKKYMPDFWGEDICEICGTRYPLGGVDVHGHDKTSHYRGKMHIGYSEIRDKVAELKGKRREWDRTKKKWEDETGKRWKDRTAERERKERKEREKKE